MDPDNQPSTSKKIKSAYARSPPKKKPPVIYPVTFEEFQKFANVEEYVLKEMQRAGPEICRINYKIRHKYYPTVYKQFYASQEARAKMLRHGLTLKPIPKFLKEKLMLMPTEASSETNTHRHTEKQPVSKSKTGLFQKEDKNKKVLPCTNSTNSRKSLTDKNIKKKNQTSMEKENVSRRNLKLLSEREKHSPKLSSKIDQVKGKRNVDAPKITTFFSAIGLLNKPETSKHSAESEDIRKRKSDGSEIDRQIKRRKNKAHRAIIDDSPGVESNVQIMVDAVQPVNAELSEATEKQKRNAIEKDKYKRDLKRKPNQCKSNESRRKNSLDEFISDDSDIQSQNEIINLTASSEVCMLDSSKQKSPLPKRNRTEDFRKPTSCSRQEKVHKRHLSSSDAEMALLSVSGVSAGRVGKTKKEIYEWLDNGLKCLEECSVVEKNTSEYLTEEYVVVDRLKAINTYPTEMKKYIKHLLSLEIQKRRNTNLNTAIQKPTPTTKVTAAFLQMTFEDYKNLINAEKLFTQGLARGESSDSIIANLKEVYLRILRKEQFWPKDVHVKLSALRDYLRSKGIQAIHLKDIPPKILTFEEVLEHTNLKERTSLIRNKPPDSYKHLLDLCRKEYINCCEKGEWIAGMKFINKKTVQQDSEDILEDSVTLFSESMSMATLKVYSSCSRDSQQTITGDKVDAFSGQLDNNQNSENIEAHNSAVQELIDNVLNESDEVMREEVAISTSKNLNHLTLAKESIPIELTKSSKSNTSSTPQMPTKRTMEEMNLSTVNSYDIEKEIENCLDEIFKDSGEDNYCIKAKDVPTDYIGLKRALLDSQVQTSQEISQSSREQRISKNVNVADITAAGQLLNNITQPVKSVSSEKSTTLPSTSTAPSKDEHFKPQENLGLIPPSPNLFQSSGESDTKCTQSPYIETRSAETVYVPCNHSITFNTEENNVTALSIDQTSDNQDPFAETSVNHKDTIEVGVNMTMLPTTDSDVVVKQEPLSMPDVGEEGCYCDIDDSVHIIDLPPTEPIVIEDEETAPDLLDMLLSRPTQITNRPLIVENLTHLSTSSCMDNFPQAQQLSSNFSLTQVQSQDMSTIRQTLEAEKGSERVQIMESTDVPIRYNSIEIIKAEETTEVELPSEHGTIDSAMNPVNTKSQEQNAIDDQSKIKIRSTRNKESEESFSKSIDPLQELQTIESSSLSKSLDHRQSSKQTSTSGSAEEVIDISHAPQNIPSVIELSESCSNKSLNQSMNLKESAGSKSNDDVSASVVHKVAEPPRSMVEGVLEPIDIDGQSIMKRRNIPRKTESDESFSKSTDGSEAFQTIEPSSLSKSIEHSQPSQETSTIASAEQMSNVSIEPQNIPSAIELMPSCSYKCLNQSMNLKESTGSKSNDDALASVVHKVPKSGFMMEGVPEPIDIDGQSIMKRRNIPRKTKSEESFSKSTDASQAFQTIESSDLNKSIDLREQSVETPRKELSAELSYVSIAPQSIPSVIELTPNCSNESSSDLINFKAMGDSSFNDDALASVVHKVPESGSMMEGVPEPINIDSQPIMKRRYIPRKTESAESFSKSTDGSQAFQTIEPSSLSKSIEHSQPSQETSTIASAEQMSNVSIEPQNIPSAIELRPSCSYKCLNQSMNLKESTGSKSNDDALASVVHKVPKSGFMMEGVPEPIDIDGQSIMKRRNIPRKTESDESFSKSTDGSEAFQTIEPSSLSKSIEHSQPSQETSTNASAEQMSNVSIGPQNIPSVIEITPNCSNNSLNQSTNLKESGDSSSNVDVSASVVLKVPEAQSMMEGVPEPIDIDGQSIMKRRNIPRKRKIEESFSKSTDASQAFQTIEPSSLSKFIEHRQPSKETSTNASAEQMSNVSIEPQNIPSAIEITPNCSNKCLNQSTNLKESAGSNSNVNATASVVLKVPEAQSTMKGVPEPIDIDGQSIMKRRNTTRKTESEESFSKSTNASKAFQTIEPSSLSKSIEHSQPSQETSTNASAEQMSNVSIEPQNIPSAIELMPSCSYKCLNQSMNLKESVGSKSNDDALASVVHKVPESGCMMEGVPEPIDIDGQSIMKRRNIPRKTESDESFSKSTDGSEAFQTIEPSSLSKSIEHSQPSQETSTIASAEQMSNVSIEPQNIPSAIELRPSCSNKCLNQSTNLKESAGSNSYVDASASVVLTVPEARSMMKGVPEPIDIDGESIMQRRNIPRKRKIEESFSKSTNASQAFQTIEPSSLSKSIEHKQPSKETSSNASAEQMSNVSIAAQNIPSVIELTPSCSNKSLSQLINLKKSEGSRSNDSLSASVVLKVPERLSTMEGVPEASTDSSKKIKNAKMIADDPISKASYKIEVPYDDRKTKIITAVAEVSKYSKKNAVDHSAGTMNVNLSTAVSRDASRQLKLLMEDKDVPYYGTCDIHHSVYSQNTFRYDESCNMELSTEIVNAEDAACFQDIQQAAGVETVDTSKNVETDSIVLRFNVSMEDSGEVEMIEESEEDLESSSEDVSNCSVIAENTQENANFQSGQRCHISINDSTMVEVSIEISESTSNDDSSQDIELMEVSTEEGIDSCGDAEVSKEDDDVVVMDVEDNVCNDVLLTVDNCVNTEKAQTSVDESKIMEVITVVSSTNQKAEKDNLESHRELRIGLEQSELVNDFNSGAGCVTTSVSQQPEPAGNSPKFLGGIPIEQTTAACKHSNIIQKFELCGKISTKEQTKSDPTQQSVVTEQEEKIMNAPSRSAAKQPFIVQKQKTFIIPALFPLAAIRNDRNNELIEVTAQEGQENENEGLIEVPLLIDHRFIKSLPFSTVTREQLQQTNKESTIYSIKVNLEFNLEEHCFPTNTNLESTTPHQQATTSYAQQTVPELSNPQSDQKINTMCLRSKRTLQKVDVKNAPSTTKNSIPNHTRQMPSKTKRTLSKTKKKNMPRNLSKKQSESDFVPQKTHEFRSLVLGAGKKSPTSRKTRAEQSLQTVEEIDYLIEDASQVIASSTASQILGSDCTYFENSQLLRNIDEHCNQARTEIPNKKKQHPPSKPKVNTLNHLTMSEGILARKVWKINLHWKTNNEMAIEVRCRIDRQWFTLCDESAKLLYNFTKATWSDVLRVLKEIDNFEYKHFVQNNVQAVTPLHQVLRSLFDSATNVVNVRLINDSYMIYANCEKASPKYRKPFQCLTKTIPQNILNRMKTLKENLLKNNSDA